MKTTVRQESLPTGGQTLAISGRMLEDEFSLKSTIRAQQRQLPFFEQLLSHGSFASLSRGKDSSCGNHGIVNANVTSRAAWRVKQANGGGNFRNLVSEIYVNSAISVGER